MAAQTGSYFARIAALARIKLTQAKINRDITPDRAILSIQGNFLQYRVIIKETMRADRRRCAYYLLLNEQVVVGLDNHAGRNALRQKYGAAFSAHINELIPHRHSRNKRSVELTASWTADKFLNELERLIEES